MTKKEITKKSKETTDKCSGINCLMKFGFIASSTVRIIFLGFILFFQEIYNIFNISSAEFMQVLSLLNLIYLFFAFIHIVFSIVAVSKQKDETYAFQSMSAFLVMFAVILFI